MLVCLFLVDESTKVNRHYDDQTIPSSDTGSIKKCQKPVLLKRWMIIIHVQCCCGITNNDVVNVMIYVMTMEETTLWQPKHIDGSSWRQTKFENTATPWMTPKEIAKSIRRTRITKQTYGQKHICSNIIIQQKGPTGVEVLKWIIQGQNSLRKYERISNGELDEDFTKEATIQCIKKGNSFFSPYLEPI
jgi:hypothetical protein